MTYKALVVDDDPDVLEIVGEILDSIDHQHDDATCQEEARQLLARNRYSYYLLDLEIPVRSGKGFPRIQSGENLLGEIIRRRGTRREPVIVITGHGKHGPDLAVRMMRLGASDYVSKPFPSTGRTLDIAIREALAGGDKETPVRIVSRRRPFEGGELTFYPSRVELCGIKVCGDEDSGMIRRILDVLQVVDAQGRPRSFSGEELAEMIGTDGGPTAVAGVIRNFRRRVQRTLLAEAGIEIDPAVDLIVNDRQHGYRFSGKISVVERPNLFAVESDEICDAEVAGQDEDLEASNTPDEDSLACWILAELKKAGRIRKQQIIQRTGCSDSTVRRALVRLREEGKIAFVGSARSGYWRLA